MSEYKVRGDDSGTIRIDEAEGPLAIMQAKFIKQLQSELEEKTEWPKAYIEPAGIASAHISALRAELEAVRAERDRLRKTIKTLKKNAEIKELIDSTDKFLEMFPENKRLFHDDWKDVMLAKIKQ